MNCIPYDVMTVRDKQLTAMQPRAVQGDHGMSILSLFTQSLIRGLRGPARDRLTCWRLLATLLCLMAGPALATTYQSHDSIRHAAKVFLGQQARGLHKRHVAQVDHLDPRLHVKHCGRALETFLPPGSSVYTAMTVGVRCRGASPWTLYVPAHLKVLDKVIVAARPLQPGHRVTAEDFTITERDLSTLHTEYTSDPRDVLGKRIKQPVLANNVLTPYVLERSRVVHRGDRVTIIARDNGLEVRMMGQALMDGAKGDEIKVRNLSSKQIVVGTVAAEGMINVHL